VQLLNIIINNAWIIPLDINCCPGLRLRLDPAAPRLQKGVWKVRGSTLNLVTQGEGPPYSLSPWPLCESY